MKDLSDWKTNSMQKHIPNMSRDGSQTKNLSVNGGTCYKCGEKNCDAVGENIHQCKTIIMDQSGSQTKRKRKATTGSTVKAHLLDWEKEFELWCDVTEVDRVSRESIKGFITTELLGKILEHNKDEMTGLYDFDGIALEVISLAKK